MKISSADRVVLEAVDPLGEERLRGSPEDERERRAGTGGVLRGAVGVMQA